MEPGQVREIKTEDLWELIRKGAISTWAATRVMVPIARAIPEHGKALSENLSKASLSTRELVLLFRHYQKANRKHRENLVQDPLLFLKTVHAREQAAEVFSFVGVGFTPTLGRAQDSRTTEDPDGPEFKVSSFQPGYM